jgi:hypothetical protein
MVLNGALDRGVGRVVEHGTRAYCGVVVFIEEVNR